MNTLDNIITSRNTLNIGNSKVLLAGDTGGVECACIICNDHFWVYPQNDSINAYGAPLQTLMCGTCLTNLKLAIKREKEQDYGW
jgi:hypothetical protein